jgi:hypothetical protein
VGAMWPTPGLLVLVKLPLMSIMILLAFGLLGEFSAVELTALRAVVRRQALTG